MLLLLLTACGTSIDNTRWREYTVGREYSRARLLLSENKKDDARRIFSNLRRLEPTNLGALYNEARLTIDSGDRETLAEELLALIDSAKNPKLHAAYLSALSQITTDRHRREDLLAKALEIDPENCLAHALLALRLDERGEFTKAYEHNLRAAQGSEPPPRVFRRLGAYEAEHGKRDDAIKHFESYLIFEPDDVLVLYNLGTLYLHAEDWSKAESYLSAAYGLDRQDLDITLNYAKAAIENGRYEIAKTLLDRAKRLNPKEPMIYYNLAVFQAERLNKYRDAIRNFASYLANGGTEIRRVNGWIVELKEKLEK